MQKQNSKSSTSSTAIRRKNQKKKKTLRQTPQGQRAPVLHLSPCSHEYLRSLADPFDTSLTPCIPDTNSTPSFKTAAWARGTFSTSTSAGSFGSVAFNPWTFLEQLSTSAANRTVPITFTNGSLTYAASDKIIDTTFLNPLSGGRTYASLNYNVPPVAPGLASLRVVSAGLKVRCITPTLYEGGQLAKIKRLGPSTIEGLTNAQVFSSPIAELDTPKQHKWHKLTYTPDMSYMYDYQDTFGPVGFNHSFGYTSDNQASGTTLAFVSVNAGTGSSLSFEWYARVTYEVIGTGCPAFTGSHSDLVGFSAIRSALDQQPMTILERDANASYSSLLQSVYNAASTLSYIALPAAGTALANRQARMEQNWRNDGLV